MVLGWIRQNLIGTTGACAEVHRKRLFFLWLRTDLSPGLPQALAQTYLVLGDFGKAMAEANRAIQSSPGLPIAQMYLASAAGQSGQWEQGEKARHALLSSDPEFRISRLRRFHFQEPERWEAILEGLRAVELPE